MKCPKLYKLKCIPRLPYWKKEWNIINCLFKFRWTKCFTYKENKGEKHENNKRNP